MKLSDFLAALDTADVVITVNSIDGEQIIKFYANASDSALDDTLENRTIRKFEIKGATAILVVLNDAQE